MTPEELRRIIAAAAVEIEQLESARSSAQRRQWAAKEDEKHILSRLEPLQRAHKLASELLYRLDEQEAADGRLRDDIYPPLK